MLLKPNVKTLQLINNSVATRINTYLLNSNDIIIIYYNNKLCEECMCVCKIHVIIEYNLYERRVCTFNLNNNYYLMEPNNPKLV